MDTINETLMALTDNSSEVGDLSEGKRDFIDKFDVLKGKKRLGDFLPDNVDFKIDLFNISSSIDDIPLDDDFAWLLTLLLLSMIWVTYCIYYHSRVVGFIATILSNSVIIPRYFYSETSDRKQSKGSTRPHFHVGSLSVSFISGKIMFRDVAFITPDFTFRAQDGFIIFRWWLPYIPKDVRSVDCSREDKRVFILLGGLELHVYNRSQTYHRLEKLFNLPTKLIPGDHGSFHGNDEDEPKDDDPLTGTARTNKVQPSNNDELIQSYLWRDLIPMTKIEISTGRFVFGNSLMPSTLSVTFDDAHISYSTKPALSPHDLFTHILKCKVDRFKVILTPSPKYLGLTDEPPRYMGDGFVVIQSKSVDFYYYQDEPGFVSLELEKVELSTGDVVERFTYPTWGLDIKCEKSTDFNYGPWADRQRESLYNFFYPVDYLPSEIASKPKIGELRTFESFEFKLSTLRDSLIDILFVTEDTGETMVTHFNIGAGSCLDISIPWITKETGYESHIRGQILHLDATTCLNFRALAESETLEFDVKIKYPNVWNHHQEWLCNLTGHKATVDLIFAHKMFFCHLIDDWAGKTRPDILKFVPYTWKISIVLKEFELITLANQYNWIDCSSKHNTKNVQLAICGDKFEMTFDLPFDEFVPTTVPIKMWIQGESLEAAIHLPESNPNRELVDTLYNKAKLSPENFKTTSDYLKASDLYPIGKRWRNHSSGEKGWTNCWSVPIAAISITYTYHPSPVIQSQSKPRLQVSFSRDTENVANTPEREEAMLRPIRPESRTFKCRPPVDFYPGSMTPDLAEVDIEIGPSIVTLYGVILRILWDIKENYVGEYQSFTDFETNPKARKKQKKDLSFTSRFTQATLIDRTVRKNFDERLYRPLAVTVSLTMHEISAHLMKECSDEDVVCPTLSLERLSFEMDKKFTETKLQLLLSPLTIKSEGSDLLSPSDGTMVMSSLQFRGHAMFSELNRPLESETLEYAWLIEVQLGDISGNLNLSQVEQVTASTKSLVFGVIKTDPTLQSPVPYHKCLHDVPQFQCNESEPNSGKFCPDPEDIKYRMVRLTISSVDFSLVDPYTSVNFNLIPIKLATCNLHSTQSNDGLTVVIEKVSIRQFIIKNYLSSSHHRIETPTIATDWNEASDLSFGPLVIDTTTSLNVATNYTTSQNEFLSIHDERMKRLWFIWKDNKLRRFSRAGNLAGKKVVRKCGCVGMCAFFGSNYLGIDFLETKKPVDRFDVLSLSSVDYQFGESILRKGEPVTGFTLTGNKVEVTQSTDGETTSVDSQSYFSAEEGDSVSVYDLPGGSILSEETVNSVSTFQLFDSESKSLKRTIVVVKFEGDIRIIVCPPSLNGLKTMVTSIAHTITVLGKSASKESGRNSKVSNEGVVTIEMPLEEDINFDEENSSGSDFVVVVDGDTSAIPLKPIPTVSVVTPSNKRKSKVEVLPVVPIEVKQDIPTTVIGVVKVQCVNLSAKLSGFKLEGEWTGLSLNSCHREEMRNTNKWSESSVTGRMSQASVSLLEEAVLEKQLVVKVNVGKSQTTLATQNLGKEGNSAEFVIGPILVDVPEHPITLHGMVTRSSRLLTDTIQELRSNQPSRASTHFMGSGHLDPGTPIQPTQPATRFRRQKSVETRNFSRHVLLKSLVVQFNVSLESFSISASLLPSLRAQYKVGQVASNGKTGSRAKFVLNIKEHNLTFDTKVVTAGANLPSEHVSLPPIHVLADQIEDNRRDGFKLTPGPSKSNVDDGVKYRRGSFLNVQVNIDSFEHSLTTALLNHLLLVQNVFVKEVNEVLQKMSGGDHNIMEDPRSTPDPAAESSLIQSQPDGYVLFKLHLRLQGFRITATTPTMSAVRLEFGALDVQLSNRIISSISSVETEPIAVQFSICLESITIGAALLPTLRAQYKIGQVTSNGTTGSKAKFVVDVPEHHLSFDSNDVPVEAKLPSSARVSFPAIHVSAEYLQDPNEDDPQKVSHTDDGIVLRKGSYLNALAEIEFFDHSLTTDLLNHMILAQKVLMKEVNEVLQHMMTEAIPKSKPDPESQAVLRSRQGKYVLFTLDLHVQGIQITATTPTNNAFRLETGAIDLQLSNRVQNMSINTQGHDSFSLKLFVKLQVDLSVALGQLFRNPIFEEAEPEFQQLAYFKTRIVTRNALQDELVTSTLNQEDKEAVLITLKRPLIYIQPLALDKAVLVWLNYKNAFEYWSEQRAVLAKEVLAATAPGSKVHPQIPELSSPQNMGTLFLQLTVDDLGICLPVSNNQTGVSATLGSRISYDCELKSALVITLESTRISACSCGPLVSKAKFNGFCFRFADDFETSLDDWKPDPGNPSVMNVCVVSEGTYEICSRTTSSQLTGSKESDAKWFLNVSWKMEGFDIHVDTSIGRQLSSLFTTLTALAGDEDIDTLDDSYNSVTGEVTAQEPCVTTQQDQESQIDQQEQPMERRRLSFLRDLPPGETKRRSRLIEKELNEQAVIINELRMEGADKTRIEAEIKKLNELESAVFNDFKRDVIKKLRRQSSKTGQSFREKMRYDRGTFSRMPSMISPEHQDTEFNKTILGAIQQESLGSESETVTVTTGSGSDSVRRDVSQETLAHSPVSDVGKLPLSPRRPESAKEHRPPLTPLTSESTSGSDPYLLKCGLSCSSPSTPDIERDVAVVKEFVQTTSAEHSKPVSESNTRDANSSTSSSSSPILIPRIVTAPTPNQNGAANTSGTSSTGAKDQAKEQTSHTIQEPNVDFELDVMIYFNSGKCVLHTRDTTEEGTKKGMVKERSFVGNLLDVGYNASVQPSPKSNQPRYVHTRTSSGSLPKTLSTGGLKANVSSSRLRYSGITVSQHPAECTVFLIPGLDIKVHYNSKNVSTETPLANNSAATSFVSSPNASRQGMSKDLEFHSTTTTTSSKKSATKKAACFAWMTLHSIPEETVITPHILDFLEQALEPIPIDTPVTVISPSNDNPDDILTSAPAQYAVYGSFPVDVIVYLHVQPSVLRFSCLPVSRVECLLQLPSVDLVFSSKRAEDELVDIPAPTQPKSKLVAPGKAVLSGGRANHRRAGSDFRGIQPESSVGGLSMSGCLADFSLYIFHPYGGQKKSTVDMPSSLNKGNMSSNVDKMLSSRKDSLSLQVEFVKVNISRSRKIVFTLESTAPRLAPEKQYQSVNIKFSALCDIGSASFKYDMRRLTEILAFPRAWYRKAIWKRMFLGDESIRSTLFSDESDEEDEEEEQSSGTPSSASEDEGIEVAGKKSKNLDGRKTSFDTKKDKGSLWLNLNDGSSKRSPSKQADWKQYGGTTPAPKQPQNVQVINAPWETLVLFAVNLSKLNIQMNMGNVMGNSTWLTRGFRSQGRVSIDSSGHKRFVVGLGLDGSALDAKGGIVGGVIEISSVETQLMVKEDRGKEPDHVVKLKLKTLQQRMDYMGTSVLMMRISDLDLTLRDEWRIDQFHGNKNFDHPTKRPALVFIHGNLVWDQLQIMMSKSTTPDIVKMIAKLEEFFTQQFTSSKRVLSSLEPSQRSFHRSSSLKGQRSTKKQSTGGVSQQELQQPQTTATATQFFEARHHRHWQRALKLVSGVQINSLPNPLPDHGTILGGTVELTGRNISVACFYGINFRSKAWGIFSLRQPTISFATESQELLLNGTDLTDTHVIQNLSVSLGRTRREHMDTALYAQHTTMATVCRMSRSVMFPPQFRHMHEWFQYTFATSDLDEVSRFPVIEFERSGDVTTPSGDAVFGGGEVKRRISMSPKSQQFHHNKEVIFAFPSFQMELKTEHLQAPKTPTSDQPKPVIDCTFVTDFDDHIFVAVDAEAYFFLHELITSYIRERDPNYGKPQLSPGTESKPTSSPAGSSRNKSSLQSEPSVELTADWREFVCHTWHLEPTVRLLSWAGKNIEPYGVDYILQRLGFSQARTTIPKWIQRGAMDPLDKILSLVMYRIIHSNSTESAKTKTDPSTGSTSNDPRI